MTAFMSQQYETTVIVTPVLTEEELKNVISDYVKFLKSKDAEIVHEHYWGLRQLAYPIKKKTTGFYYTVEYKANTELISTFELALKRDEKILRFLTVKLDKYSIEYNERKRKGLIGRKAQDKANSTNQSEEQTEKAEA